MDTCGWIWFTYFWSQENINFLLLIDWVMMDKFNDYKFLHQILPQWNLFNVNGDYFIITRETHVTINNNLLDLLFPSALDRNNIPITLSLFIL